MEEEDHLHIVKEFLKTPPNRNRNAQKNAQFLMHSSGTMDRLKSAKLRHFKKQQEGYESEK